MTRDVPWDRKRNDMKGVCSACHSQSHIEGFCTQYDALVNLYNEKFAKPGSELMARVRKNKLLSEPGKRDFAYELTWIWFELWHHEGRRMRHGASMMGPDYTHWHGSYKVAKHFHTKFLPKVEALAKKKGDREVLARIAEILSRPEHGWFDGQDRQEVEKIRKIYAGYDKLHLRGQ